MTPSTLTKYLAQMFCAVLLVVSCSPASAAEAGSWVGEYRNPKLLNGKATFQLSIEQDGSKLQVSFDAVRNDGKGPAPEGYGPATAARDTLQFRFTDNFKNAGTGTIKRSGDGISLSIKTTRVGNKDATNFYGENIQLKRVGKQ
jgi:hypothetical protein